MAKVGILYICTGRYTVFWPDFYRTFQKKFLPGSDKTFFVFTDAERLDYDDAPDVRRICQKALDWPYSSLLRFKMFVSQQAALEQMDFLFFANANLICSQTVTEAEFLPRPQRGERLLVVQQPGFWDKKPLFCSYDRNPKCRAYIPYNCGRVYVSGGLNGGTAAAFLALCHELARRTEDDLARGVIARWHDESQLNRYAAERSDYRLLTPAYWYPEGWDLPFEAKIVVRDKARYFDVAAVKHQAARPRPWLVRKGEAFRENWLPYLWYARDALLHKQLKGD